MLIVDKAFSNIVISILIEYEYNYLLKSLVRSLSSDTSTVSVKVDKARWKDELNLMKYYYDIKNNRSLAVCLAPIIIANRDINEILNEAVTAYNIMYKNSSSTALSIYVIILYILNEQIKPNLIAYQNDLEDSSEIIEFQRYKINLLMLDDDDKILTFALNNLYNLEDKSFYIKEKELIIRLRDIVKEKLTNALETIEFNSNIEVLSDYLLNLRNMKIKRKAYEGKINPLDIIQMEINKEYTIPLIGNIKIIKKYFNENILLIEAVSKSESYTFRFKKA
ncbi:MULTISPECIES: hypothetical protein [Acetoanaerobium]|jgi:hypothetical protein|uniref:Uncharacterized protein n=1 Tax=Acetoanaerobium sticklandii (strain ATCC 12662 / DSM 519 / JCM 1433 / CCUG 9281 / NCIMB 10654 / HF) TaxID=499177 RepID=E3PXV5_ACESD|nr:MULTISPECIES: hypothetical protein [Acetoanaerobium]CBH21270.1 protein of unknown function [Acetoanaerobium sticklandii]